MKRHDSRKEEANKILKRQKLESIDFAVPHSFRDKRGFLDILYTDDDANWDEWIEKNDRIVLITRNFETICIRMGEKLLRLDALKNDDNIHPIVLKKSIFSDCKIGNPIYFSRFFPDRHRISNVIPFRRMTRAECSQSRSSIIVYIQGEKLVLFTTSYSKQEWFNHLCCSAKKWLLLQELLLLNSIPSEVIHHFSYKRIWELDPVDYSF